MEATGPESKRSRNSIEASSRQNQLDSDIDSDGDEEAVLLAAAAWSEKQTGSARVEPSEFRESRTLQREDTAQGGDVDEYTVKLRGNSEELLKLQTILRNDLVESTFKASEEGNSELVCEFPSLEKYEEILSCRLGEYGDIEAERVKGVKKRKRVEDLKGSKRGSSRRAAIMMKSIVE